MKMLKLSCLVVATILATSLLLFPQKASASQTLTIVIDSVDVSDGYYRYHGLKIDGPLPTNFWTDEPSTIIGTSYGSFHYETTVTVSDGDHYIVYGVSAYMGVWHAKIYVNGNLVGEGDTDVYNHLTGWVPAEEPTPNIPSLSPYIADGSDEDPYIAGYCDTPVATTLRVRVTTSFPDTPPSGKTIQEIIPVDNYIAGGICIHGADSVLDQTDYGFVASLSLDHNGVVQYNMAFYVHHEPNTFPLNPWVTLIWSKAVVLNIAPSEPVTLTIRWDSDPNSRFVWWLYTIDGIEYLGGLYNTAIYSSTIIRAFYIGTGWHFVPLGSYYYYFYQFGVYSETMIPNSGWTVRFEHPQYYTSDYRWRYVQKATVIEGDSAYNDRWWRWGGMNYPYGNACYYDYGLEEGFEVEFYGMDGT